jgi:hypothetical protein
MTDDAEPATLAEMSDDELHALIDRCRHEERRSRDPGRKQEWANLRHSAEGELARRSGRAPRRP